MRYPAPLPRPQAPSPSDEYEQDAYQPLKEGTISFWLRHPNPAWQVDGSGYDFGCCGDRNLWVSSAKLPDGNLAFCIAGVRDEPIIVTTAIFEPGEAGVMVAIAWDEGATTLYINGKPAARIPVGEAKDQ